MSKPISFRGILRERLIPVLYNEGYQLTYDHLKVEEGNQEQWIFKLVFQGNETIEVSNEDWRDYIEHFHFYINGKQIFTANVMEYEDLEECYSYCEKSLLRNIGIL